MAQKQFTTAFNNKELLKECKKLAIEYNCSVNDILKLGYKILIKNSSNEEVLRQINKE